MSRIWKNTLQNEDKEIYRNYLDIVVTPSNIRILYY